MFLSSGNLVADRRFEFARELEARGDLAAAADLYAQALELAPGFASAWFALGEARLALGEREAAIAAFRQARVADPQDRHGAVLHLARLGAAPLAAPPAGYIEALFDGYAPRFDAALDRLAYQGPALLLEAVIDACTAAERLPRFRTAIDLGCGTGLSGAAFRPFCDELIGVDLSSGMIERARAKALYARLHVGEIESFLARQQSACADLIIAADVFVYLADLRAILAQAGRVLAPRGLFAFSVESHGGNGVIVGDKLRFAHGADHVRGAIDGACLDLIALREASTRHDAGMPVPGLIAVARPR